jgi:MFS transporter, UMF1 family
MKQDKNNQKKNIFLWGLYDFANTPLTTAMGGLFLAQWVVIDNKFDDIWYGATFTLSTILLLLTSPFWGAWSDKLGRRMPFVKWITLLLIIIGILMGLVSTSTIDRIPRMVIVLGLFFLLQYFYQVSLIFYNSLLDFLSSPKTRGKISGIGQAFGEMGWLLGNVMLLPFAAGTITILGQPGRGQVFIPATLVLIFLGLPMILWLKENKQNKVPPKTSFAIVYRETIQGFKLLLRKDKNVAIFLIGFMFLSDALLTASLYFAIYLDQAFKINDTQKVIIVAILEIVSTVSALVISKIGDKLGIKKILIIACIDLTVVYTLVGLTSLSWILYVLAIFIGFGYGGFYTTSRALLVKLSPPSRLGEYFGFFSTFQKFASIIGPLTWGAIVFLLKDYGIIRYRIGILSLSFLMLIGTIILLKVKERKAQYIA